MEDDFLQVIEEFEFDGSLITLYSPKMEVDVFGEKLYAAEGIWSEKNEETGEFDPDWDLTWFWRVEDGPENYFYYEQDCFETALHNLTNIVRSKL